MATCDSYLSPKHRWGRTRYRRYRIYIWADGTDGAEGAGGAIQGAGILWGEAWFQDLSMRQGAGMTSWLMLTPTPITSKNLQWNSGRFKRSSCGVRFGEQTQLGTWKGVGIGETYPEWQ